MIGYLKRMESQIVAMESPGKWDWGSWAGVAEASDMLAVLSSPDASETLKEDEKSKVAMLQEAKQSLMSKTPEFEKSMGDLCIFVEKQLLSDAPPALELNFESFNEEQVKATFLSCAIAGLRIVVVLNRLID